MASGHVLRIDGYHVGYENLARLTTALSSRSVRRDEVAGEELASLLNLSRAAASANFSSSVPDDP